MFSLIPIARTLNFELAVLIVIHVCVCVDDTVVILVVKMVHV